MPIIDGKNIKYSIRNGKILDEELITGGLVCYLNMLGDNNDNYRNILLDLSGSERFRELQNFAYSNNSGYTSSEIKLDHIDDKIVIDGFNYLNNYSILFNYNFTDSNDTGNEFFGINNYQWQIYQHLSNTTGLFITETAIENCLPSKINNKVAITVTENRYLSLYVNDNCVDIDNEKEMNPLQYCYFKIMNYQGIVKDIGLKIEKLFVYNKVLSDNDVDFMFNNYL